MNKRFWKKPSTIILVLLVLLALVGVYVFFIPKPQRWMPGYCAQYSGVYSYGGGGSGRYDCERAGCKPIERELPDDPNTFDDEKYVLLCKRRLFP